MRVLIEMGMYSLDLTVDADTDFDDRFKAHCNDTGETIYVNGWMIESIDIIDTITEDARFEADRQAAFAHNTDLY